MREGDVHEYEGLDCDAESYDWLDNVDQGADMMHGPMPEGVGRWVKRGGVLTAAHVEASRQHTWSLVSDIKWRDRRSSEHGDEIKNERKRHRAEVDALRTELAALKIDMVQNVAVESLRTLAANATAAADMIEVR